MVAQLILLFPTGWCLTIVAIYCPLYLDNCMIPKEHRSKPPLLHNSAQIIATSPDVTVKLDLTCWNKVFHVYPKLRITTTITGPTIRLVYPSTQYCSTHSYEIKGLRIYNTSNQELQQSSLVPISSILRHEFLTTSFLAFSGLKMPKTTSLEIPGLDSPLSSLDSPD